MTRVPWEAVVITRAAGTSRNQTGRETLASSIEAAVTMAIRWGVNTGQRGVKSGGQDPAPPFTCKRHSFVPAAPINTSCQFLE